MTEYDGPAFSQKKESQSLKNRRFNQLTQREGAKSHFEPAMKERRKEFPTISNVAKTVSSPEHSLFESHKASDMSDINGELGSEVIWEQQQVPLKETRSESFATTQEEYQIPFLKKNERQVKKLNQASLENVMNERQTQPMSKPVQPNRPARTLAETYPSATQTQKEKSQELNETTSKIPQPYEAEAKKERKPVFQPKELPKPYKGQAGRKEDVETTRELAKRLVKTRETFLLFEH